MYAGDANYNGVLPEPATAQSTQKTSLDSETTRTQENSTKLDTDVEKVADTKATEDPADPNVVDWDGPNDPENPMNWPRFRKVVNVALVSGICFVTPLASCKP